MSRRDREREREPRNPETKRRRSGFDQEPPTPSPNGDKSSRKGGGEPDTAKSDDARPRRRFHDSMQLPHSDPKARPEPTETNPEDEKKKKSTNEGRGRNEDPARVPRFRSYFQHDERGNARQAGRSFGRGAASDRHWTDSTDDGSERTISKSATYNSQRKDGKLHTKEDSSSVWHHDGFSKMETEDPPLARKRPTFREKKIPIDSENTALEPVRPSHSDQPVSASKVREERNNNDPWPVDRSEKPTVGDGRDEHRSSFSSRERHGNGNSRERERFSGRQGYCPSNTWGAKWKHDLFEEANRSPTMNEEDQIAKVEELLAL